MKLAALAALAVLAALAPLAAAQGLYSIDGNGNLRMHTGPQAPPCAGPLGAVLLALGYDHPGVPCETPGDVGSTALGDVDMDRAQERVWITDGLIAAAYETSGHIVMADIDVAGLLGAPLTGFAWDPGLGAVWVTDGHTLGWASIDVDGTCHKATLLGSFPLPIPTPATALSHDPLTDTLWIVDEAGFLTQVTKGGALGPMGSKSVVGLGCGMSAPLFAVAADPGGPAGRVYVSDGEQIAAIDATAPIGTLASGTFYSPFPCYNSPAGAVRGLVLAAAGISYGAISGGTAFYPKINAPGHSFVPNPSLEIQIQGAHDGELAVLVLGNSYLCPPVTVSGLALHVSPPLLIAGSVVIVGDSGWMPLPIAPGTPIGHTVFMQWGLIHPLTLKASATRGLAMTTSLP